MESTGVYWIALHQKLEAAGIEVYLVNARHVRCVPGRKTDVKDSQWLRQLHRFGLLNASFRPEDITCRLRSLHRHRDNLVSSSASEIQHMQKALQQMNLHLHHVVSDITGLTGLRIIDAILSGQHDPEQLVKLRDKRVYKSTPQQMQAALVGDYRPEHLFVLSQSLQAYRFYQARIEECDREMEPLLEKLALADALRLAAQSVARTQTCLGIFYRRKQAHLGAPKATTATARKLASLIYHLLKYKQPYQEPDPAIYQLRLQKSALIKLQSQALALG